MSDRGDKKEKDGVPNRTGRPLITAEVGGAGADKRPALLACRLELVPTTRPRELPGLSENLEPDSSYPDSSEGAQSYNSRNK